MYRLSQIFFPHFGLYKIFHLVLWCNEFPYFAMPQVHNHAPSAMRHFDSILHGTGQAATPLAMELARYGQKVARIEGNFYSGTNVHFGCAP